ncbi:sucrase ferredoxin [Streptomyces sp. 130]|uniref:sucrase ferredoxin n=1 Tax=Streptomyces sp. 130 TaxID=2591006 RepID=UPI00117CA619|nr:sucrase ferredoxin [Streptomyces sp. 130]TRV79808.1 sucrase ferredoxin [Streptomyces sp. 130]
MTAERFFCADAARARGDALPGTAPYGLVWVLVEQHAPWPANGYDGLAVEPVTKALLYEAARAVRARILLIRRHGRRPEDAGPRRWAVLEYDASGAHRQQWGTWERDEDLALAAAALGTPGEPGQPPVVLVCAHGRHDTCCALRGRPAARALAERWPDQVWECTHVGGDRFAANVLVAPDGVYYGGLDATSSVTVVGQHLAGRVHAAHLRGYTDLFPAQQAAVAAVLARYGPAGRHDYTVTGTSRAGPHWLIRLTGPPPRATAYDVEVTAHRAAPRQLTCNGPATSAAMVHEVTAIRAG